MKKILGVATMIAACGLMMFAFAAPTTVRGYIMDTNCANGPKAQAMKGNVACATSCIKRGGDAVLLEDGSAGTVLKIANQDSIKDVVGKHVTLKGDVADGTITVASAKASPAGHKKAAGK